MLLCCYVVVVVAGGGGGGGVGVGVGVVVVVVVFTESSVESLFSTCCYFVSFLRF